MLQVDPLEWQVSAESANCIAAMVANTLGATESVLRIAARGTDIKLFLKVCSAEIWWQLTSCTIARPQDFYSYVYPAVEAN